MALLGLALVVSWPVSSAVATDDHMMIDVWKTQFPRTDFSRHSVELDSIISGGPPKDGIPPINDPRFVRPEQAASWLKPHEPVLVLAVDEDVRAYPLQILLFHEIVNDVVGGRPVAVTYCPLCNSALVFDRRVEGRVLDFGTTGKLRNSDLVMWDRQTESWWQQLTGTAIVGELTGTRLQSIPAPLVSFRTFRDSFSGGRVLSRRTGHARQYGTNPYAGYDAPGNTPFLMRGEIDRRLPPMSRVVALELGGVARAYPYAALGEQGVAHDVVGGTPVVVFFHQPVRSVVDAFSTAESRQVGTGAVFRRTVQGRTLTFRREGTQFVDEETGTRWNLVGRAVSGELQGERLQPVPHDNPFAFAWFAFHPQSGVWAVPQPGAAATD